MGERPKMSKQTRSDEVTKSSWQFGSGVQRLRNHLYLNHQGMMISSKIWLDLRSELTRLVAREDFAKTLRCAASNVKLQGDYKQ
jgi:hypothetical protein